MKIGIFGDIHGFVPHTSIMQIDFFKELCDSLDTDLNLQVGDMSHYRSLAKMVYWIYGNNDSLTAIREIESGTRDIKNLRNIKTAEVLTFTKENEVITVSGLNGAYEFIYYPKKRSEMVGEDLGRFFVQEDVEQCLHLRNIDIFLVHGCPAGLGFGREPDHGVPAIREILDHVKPAFMFCGHAHFFKEVEYNGTRIYSLKMVGEEYYILDTKTGVLEQIKSEPKH
ncbi:MAG: metallophosphoesterase [Candidatus Tectomicrobia bacterium]|nr:metallophosphoesterase [Candidatus Tectomicrobia bacterium]